MTPTPCTFEFVGTVQADGSMVFSTPHELNNEIILQFPAGYFGDRSTPQRVTIESFVVKEER